MNVRNCKRCGRIFNYVMGPHLCPKCVAEQEEIFQGVKKYVQDNPGVDIADVARECDVEVSQIRQWIREERLQFAEDSPIRIACEKCGAMIRSGCFCDKCKAEMTNDFKHAAGLDRKPVVQQPKPSTQRDKDKMRYL